MRTQEHNMKELYDEKGVLLWADIPEEHRAAILEHERPWQVEDAHWYEFIVSNWIERLEAIGFENAVVQFSGFGSQGDGASFEADVDLSKVIDHMIMTTNYYAPMLSRWMHYAHLKNAYFYLRRNPSRYCHERTVAVYWQDNIGMLDGFLIEMENALDALRVALCKRIYKDLEAEYSYRTDDTTMVEEYIETERDFSNYYDLSGNFTR